jgi:hypothetical protein
MIALSTMQRLKYSLRRRLYEQERRASRTGMDHCEAEFPAKSFLKPLADIGRRYETHARLRFRINACDSFSRPAQQRKFISSTSSRLEIVDSGRVAG